MSVILEETIEEVQTLPPEKQQQLRELFEDFEELLHKGNLGELLLMAIIFWALGKKLDESNLDELRLQLEKLNTDPPPRSLNWTATPTRPHDRAREEQWINAHRDEYLGEWVVVEGDSLIAHGHNARTVSDAAREAGIEAPYLVRIKPTDELPFGGW
jgi:hypothetical protein